MPHWFGQLRTAILPRVLFAARGKDKQIRASDIILGMSLVLIVVFSLARAITHFLPAA